MTRAKRIAKLNGGAKKEKPEPKLAPPKRGRPPKDLAAPKKERPPRKLVKKGQIADNQIVQPVANIAALNPPAQHDNIVDNQPEVHNDAMHNNEKLPKIDDQKIQKDEWLSRIVFVKTTAIDNNYVNVINKDGFEYKIGRNIIKKEAYSASQFVQEKRITRTELSEILETAGDAVFTINFITKPTEEKAKAILAAITPEELKDPKAMRELSKKVIQGEEVTMTGFLRSREQKMGRSSVIDLNAPRFNNIRLVDHRTLNWMIFKNVKYIAK